MEDKLQVIRGYYREHGVFGSPLSEHEIAQIENKCGLTLPLSYRAYLQIVGAKTPPIYIGSDCHGSRLLELTAWGHELLEESGKPFELPENAFVFWMHQGYQFEYFLVEDGVEDPATYYYYEGDNAPRLTHNQFSEWVISAFNSNPYPNAKKYF